PRQSPPKFVNPHVAYQNVVRSEEEPIFFTQVVNFQGKLRVFGVTTRAETVCLTVNDFRPFFYIDKPKGADIRDAQYLMDEWNRMDIPQPKWKQNQPEKPHKKDDKINKEEPTQRIVAITEEERTNAIGFQFDQTNLVWK